MAWMATSPTLTDRLTQLLRGDQSIADSVLREIMPRLRAIAHRELDKERFCRPLESVELVNETWLASIRKGRWHIESRDHFYSIAGRAMQQVLVRMARERETQKRKGTVHLEEVQEPLKSNSATPEEVITVSLLLDRLRSYDPAAAEMVSMHYVLGMSLEDAAQKKGLTLRQARHRWQKGKMWMVKHLLAGSDLRPSL